MAQRPSADEGSVPFSITEAIKILCAENHDRKASRDRPVDLLAVVVEVAFLSNFNAVCIWISDRSLATEEHGSTRATVTLRGSQNIRGIREHAIRQGDILRFNRLSLRPAKGDLPKGYQFYHHFQNPEAGLPWIWLDSIYKKDHMTTAERLELIIPETMKTPVDCIQRLKAWASAESDFVVKTDVTPLAPTAPVQKRSLSQAQESVGLLSDVVASVRSFHRHAVVPTFSARQKERLRARQSTYSVIVLTDQQTSVTLIDAENRYNSIFESSVGTDHILFLSSLKTQTANLIQPQRSGHGENLLVLTERSTVTQATVHELFQGAGAGSELWLRGKEYFRDDTSQLRDTQTPKDTILLDASIRDVRYQGECSVLQDWTPLQSLLITLMTVKQSLGTNPSDRIVTPVAVYLNTSQLSSPLLVDDPMVLHILCCGSLFDNDHYRNEHRKRLRRTSSPQKDERCLEYRATTGIGFLTSMIREGIVLHWTICVTVNERLGCDDYRVVNVSLQHF
jgi:hypothetical protein